VAQVLCVRLEQLKIAWRVVLRITVLVMNHFVWLKIAAKKFFHHQAMLANIAFVVGVWMAVLLHQHIAVLINALAAIPKVILVQLRAAAVL